MKKIIIIAIILIAIIACYILAVPNIRCVPHDDFGGFDLVVRNLEIAQISYKFDQKAISDTKIDENVYSFRFEQTGHALLKLNYASPSGRRGYTIISVNLSDIGAGPTDKEPSFIVADFLEMENPYWVRLAFKDSNFPCRVGAG